MDHIRDWSGLPLEMLEGMAKIIPVVEDFMAFPGVCTSWRSVARIDEFVQYSSRGIPLLMLAEKEDGGEEREFYSLSKRKIAMRLPLPETKGKQCMEAGFGWLLTVASSGDVNLLNPLTRFQIPLPSCNTFPGYLSELLLSHLVFIFRAAVSANPSHASNFVVTVIYDGGSPLGFWRPGDLSWTPIEMNTSSSIWDVTYYNRKFYVVNASAQVRVWDESSPADTSEEVSANVCLTMDWDLLDRREAYLLESSSGELLVATRNGIEKRGDRFVEYGVTGFNVIRLDLAKSQWEETSNLGGDAIFVGYSSAMSIVASRFPGVIQANSIYFTDDCWEAYLEVNGRGGGRLGLGGGEDMGIYNLQDKSIDRFSDIESYSFICPPVWISF